MLVLTFSGPSAYPGPWYLAPKVHNSPDCLHIGGWHDVAGALTFKGTHHVFQGCPNSGGWSHASSTDLVHWSDNGLGPVLINETYAGMKSSVSPCSGFVAVNDDNVPCAGFRQCGSTNGTTELNPAAHSWDVPMEVRCATNAELTEWGEPQWLNAIYYYRALPYDPVRPWKDTDGKWYYGLSTDGCNATTEKVPCAAGGRLDLFTADKFDGPWTQLAPLFTTNTTISGKQATASISGEFVTSGYFGALPGDPSGGASRVVTQNFGAPTFWVGAQPTPGGPFTPHWDKPGAVGHYDYGRLTMARTLGGDPNQVAVAGRKVLVGWIQAPGWRPPGWPLVQPASQSLGRDLSLSAGHELLQQFVPELASLRGKHARTTELHVVKPASMQLEVVATFTGILDLPKPVFGVDVLVPANGSQSVSLTVDCTAPAADADCHVSIGGATVPQTSVGPLLFGAGERGVVRMHAIVDHSIIELIVNNRTAIVQYASPPSEAWSGVRLRGPGQPGQLGLGYQASLDYWELDSI